jgi:hypothetical protein
MEKTGDTEINRTITIEAKLIDKTIAPEDLFIWSQLRLSAYEVFGDGSPFFAEA